MSKRGSLSHCDSDDDEKKTKSRQAIEWSFYMLRGLGKGKSKEGCQTKKTKPVCVSNAYGPIKQSRIETLWE